LQHHGYTVSVAFSNNSPDIECKKIEDFISQNVAGLIIISCQPQNTNFFQNRMVNYDIPSVFVERNPANLFVNYVGYHNYETTHHIVSSLIEKGFNNIALVCGPEHFSCESECIRGYKDAFYDHSLNANNDQICTTDMSKEDSFKSVLKNLPLHSLQAIITTSKNIAYGTLEALSFKNMKVPDDIQLITFSEESWTNSSKIPGVFHSSRSPLNLGGIASKLLLKNIQSPILFEPQVLIQQDQIIQQPLNLHPSTPSSPSKAPCLLASKRVKALMVDLATSRSIQLLSESFSQHTGIEIEFDFLPQDKILDRIVDTLGHAQNQYDIFMYDIPWLSYLVQNSFVADISSFIMGEDFQLEKIFQGNMENCIYDNKYYGLPLLGGSQLMFYRKDLFENLEIVKAFNNKYKMPLSPPKTWTQFNGTSEFFTRSFNPDSPTEFGTSMAGITDEELAPELLIRLWAYGGVLWDTYNRPCLNTPANVRAFTSIIDTLQYTSRSPFETSITQTVEDFSSGKTAMLITYSEYAAQISKSLQNQIIGRVGCEILPGKRSVSIGWNLGVNPLTEKRESIYALFQWLCRQDISFYITILGGQSPVTAPYHNLDLLRLYPWLAMTEKSFHYTKKRNEPYKKNTLVIPLNRIEKILCNVLRQVLNEGLSIPEALERNQQRMKQLFGSYGYPSPYCK
jgi:multiple sugar transport system substrate-binding protein